MLTGMSAFERLHPSIKEAIWNMQWESLRPLQVEAIQAIFDSEDDLILSAATASGKTEAVFLPILSRIAEHSTPSIRALYVSPLKALINDQFGRLGQLCEHAQIAVHRWHGDVSATEKRRLRETPSGVLLITPESLESQFINHGRVLAKLYSGLQFVVIDELHSFLEDVRGMHLRSLICRLRHAAGVRPRLLGLSATLGDFEPAKRFLNPDPGKVRVIEDQAGAKEVRAVVRAYVRPAESSTPQSCPLPLERELPDEIRARFAHGTNLIFCNSRSMAEELADDLRNSAQKGPVGNFLVHHGSLSKEIREDAEADLKGNSDVTVICTRTLEMGIDIGAVKTVGQVGAPWTAASLLQRLGRSGRREGEAQILRLFSIDREVQANSSVTEQLYPDLLRSIAMVELVRRRWVETPNFDRPHFSTCIHQILSVLRQTGGIAAVRMFLILCKEGAFQRITQSEFVELLRTLAEHGCIQQVESGEIILAPAGERIVEARDFYAAFMSQKEYSVEHSGEKIATLPIDLIPPPGEHMILGGRRWKVSLIDHTVLRVMVEPSKGRKAPLFLGRGGDIAAEVMQEMRRLLQSEMTPAYLHSSASKGLELARQAFQHFQHTSSDLLLADSETVWLPWAGTKIHSTLRAIAKADGLEVEISRDGLALFYRKTSPAQIWEHLSRVRAWTASPSQLAAFLEGPSSDRFDDLLSTSLCLAEVAARHLDIDGARRCAQNLLGQGSH